MSDAHIPSSRSNVSRAVLWIAVIAIGVYTQWWIFDTKFMNLVQQVTSIASFGAIVFGALFLWRCIDADEIAKDKAARKARKEEYVAAQKAEYDD